PRLTGSNQNIFRILRIERNRADRLDALFIEHRPVSRSAVVAFPNAATGRADKKRDFARRLACTRDGRDAPAHCRGTSVAHAKPGDGGGTVGRVRTVTKNGGNKKERKRCEDASHSNSESFRESSTRCEIHRRADSVSRKQIG